MALKSFGLRVRLDSAGAGPVIVTDTRSSGRASCTAPDRLMTVGGTRTVWLTESVVTRMVTLTFWPCCSNRVPAGGGRGVRGPEGGVKPLMLIWAVSHK